MRWCFPTGGHARGRLWQFQRSLASTKKKTTTTDLVITARDASGVSLSFLMRGVQEARGRACSVGCLPVTNLGWGSQSVIGGWRLRLSCLAKKTRAVSARGILKLGSRGSLLLLPQMALCSAGGSAMLVGTEPRSDRSGAGWRFAKWGCSGGKVNRSPSFLFGDQGDGS